MASRAEVTRSIYLNPPYQLVTIDQRAKQTSPDSSVNRADGVFARTARNSLIPFQAASTRTQKEADTARWKPVSRCNHEPRPDNSQRLIQTLENLRIQTRDEQRNGDSRRANHIRCTICDRLSRK